MIDLTEKFWKEAYQTHIGKMIGICFRYVANRQAAEDLAHDAFIKAIDKSDGFLGKGKFESWLCRITVNVALQYLRDQKKEKHFDDWMLNNKYSEMEPPIVDTNEGVINQADFSEEELLSVINSIPEHHRLVFNLYVIDKFTHAQIGEELGISSVTSKAHLSRARKRLRKLLYQKANEKLNQKDKKRAFFLFILPAKLRFIDQLFRRKFIHFKMQSQNTISIESIGFTKASIPIFKPLIYISKVLWYGGVSIGVITVAGIFSYNSLFPKSIIPKKEKNENLEMLISDKKDFLKLDSTTQNANMQVISNVKTVTNQKDSVILKENMKNINGMKKLNKLGLVLAATVSMALDTSGQQITDSTDSLMGYGKNWALVQSDKIKDIIDASGNVTNELNYNKIGRYGVYNENWALVQKNGLLGFIDINGDEIIKPIYDDISRFGEYQKDWALVQKNGLLGFIDINGNEIIKPIYDDISRFGEYQKDWALIQQEGLLGFIDNNGNEIIKPTYDDISKFGEYQKDWALIQQEGLLGFIDNNGNEIIKPTYGDISKFGEYQRDWALIQQDSLLGFIDNNGNEIIKPTYDDISRFGEYQKDWALVQKNDLLGFIDNNGNEIIKPIYNNIEKGEHIFGIKGNIKDELKY